MGTTLKWIWVRVHLSALYPKLETYVLNAVKLQLSMKKGAGSVMFVHLVNAKKKAALH